jgi:5'-3' exonuclease
MIKLNTTDNVNRYYIKPSLIDNETEDFIEIKSIEGLFDKTLTTQGLRSLYKKIVSTNLPILIENDLKFSIKIKDFIISIVKLNKEVEIFTENKTFLNEYNKIIASLTLKNKLIIIDTHNFYHRNYHALPEMYSENGVPTRLLKALSGLLKWIDTQGYTNIVFASESKTNLRKIYTKKILGEENAYKANRSETDTLLKQEIEICDNFLERIGYPVLRKEGYEADDVIASVANEFLKISENNVAHIFTGDKDLLQILEYDNCRIIDVKTKQLKDSSFINEKYGVEVWQFIDYQALIGDTSDNVSGIKGIGPAKAKQLLNEFGTLENILKNHDSIKGKSLQEKIINGKEDAILSKDLVYMRRELFENQIKFSDYSKKFFDINQIIKKELNKYQINY